MAVTPAVVVLGARGLAAGRLVARALDGSVHARAGRAQGDVAFEDAVEHLGALFAAGVPVVGVCASGILIRAVAPLLGDKRAEPPVVAVAEDGSCAVPLLGGHRGANALARRAAEALGCAAAVTTAGDLAWGAALDAPPDDWRLANPEDAGAAMAAALAGGALAEGEVVFRDLDADAAPSEGAFPRGLGDAGSGGGAPDGRPSGTEASAGSGDESAPSGRGPGRGLAVSEAAGMDQGRASSGTGAAQFVGSPTPAAADRRAAGRDRSLGASRASSEGDRVDRGRPGPVGGAGPAAAASIADDMRSGPDATPVTLLGTEAPAAGGPGRLVYHPRRHVLGLGCARGADPEALWALVLAALEEAGVAPGAVAAVATIDIKADEPAILEAAARLDAPLRLFGAPALEAQTPRLATPSEVVFAEVGAHGVAEAAALACAGPDAALVLPKRKTREATAALARAPEPIASPAGRPRGRVAVVGLGPGRADWRTPEASRLVAAADELVGYGLYLDLLGPLAAAKPAARFPLGGEEARCRHALERAGEGRSVALVCSGDPGVYAMASLVFELIDRGAVSDAARRAEVVVAPGVSAMHAAAARAGAPLGHDFAAVSLSDLMTPRDVILRRLAAAAEGDFALALYNPVSLRRRTLLGEARAILLRHRPAETPVVLARALGRPDEAVRAVTLDALTTDEVDMMTVVIVGASGTRMVGGRVYTPRGYGQREAAE